MRFVPILLLSLFASSSAVSVERVESSTLKALHKTSLKHKAKLEALEKDGIDKYGSAKDIKSALEKIQETLKANQKKALKASKNVRSLAAHINKVREEEIGTLGKQIKDETSLRTAIIKKENVYHTAEEKLLKEIKKQGKEQTEFGKGESRKVQKKVHKAIQKIVANKKLTHKQKKQAVKKVEKKIIEGNNDKILKKIISKGVQHAHTPKKHAQHQHQVSSLLAKAESIDKHGVNDNIDTKSAVPKVHQVGKVQHKAAAKPPAKKEAKKKEVKVPEKPKANPPKTEAQKKVEKKAAAAKTEKDNKKIEADLKQKVPDVNKAIAKSKAALKKAKTVVKKKNLPQPHTLQPKKKVVQGKK